MKMLNYSKSVQVAEEIMNKLMEENGCAWYVAFENFEGYRLMEEAGVCEEVINEYSAEL